MCVFGGGGGGVLLIVASVYLLNVLVQIQAMQLLAREEIAGKTKSGSIFLI